MGLSRTARDGIVRNAPMPETWLHPPLSSIRAKCATWSQSYATILCRWSLLPGAGNPPVAVNDHSSRSKNRGVVVMLVQTYASKLNQAISIGSCGCADISGEIDNCWANRTDGGSTTRIARLPFLEILGSLATVGVCRFIDTGTLWHRYVSPSCRCEISRTSTMGLIASVRSPTAVEPFPFTAELDRPARDIPISAVIAPLQETASRRIS